MMCDLDLLRDINNDHGHLAGDAVLRGIADVFREELRHYDIPARFGGEEFSILLPETGAVQAVEIAERIRRSFAARRFEVETSTDPIRATVSIGVAEFPAAATGADALIHEADLAVYRAKLQGRNRVCSANTETSLLTKADGQRLTSVPDVDSPPRPAPQPHHAFTPVAVPEPVASLPRPMRPEARRVPLRAGLLTALMGLVGIAAGVAGVLLGTSSDLLGLLVLIVLVGGGQALSLNLDEGGISISVVGALAGAALFGPRAALVLALATVAADWSARRAKVGQLVFETGAMTLASLSAAGVFALAGSSRPIVLACAGVVAGVVYFAVDALLHSAALALEETERLGGALRRRFLPLLPHYLAYGFVGAAIAIAYDAAGLYALAVFAIPVLLMRKTQEAYLAYAGARRATSARRPRRSRRRTSRWSTPTGC